MGANAILGKILNIKHGIITTDKIFPSHAFASHLVKYS